MTTKLPFEQLKDWWFETNGTGIDACHACVDEVYLCSWHNERLADLYDQIHKVSADDFIKSEENYKDVS